MASTLVDPLPTLELANLSQLMREVRREVLEFRQEVGVLQQENAELRQQVGNWEAMHAWAAQ